MPNPIAPFIQKLLGPQLLQPLKQRVVGLAKDFWTDGPENLLALDFTPKFLRASVSGPKTAASQAKPSSVAGQRTDAQRFKEWHAEPGEISERMWGEGYVAPGGHIINGLLIKPLGLTKEMSVLDLSAGLGGRMRHTAATTGAYITGLEPDAAIAARGMQISVKEGKTRHASVAHYDPAKLSLSRSYDCILARETFYRLPDYKSFFATIAKNSKPRAQLAFTDYIVEPDDRQKPAVQAWLNNEKLAKPLSIVEAVEAWEKVGFSLRVHEDLSDFYKAEVLIGMKRLMDFLASGVHPDKETANAILRRLETWKLRLGAMDAGMKFYRFYGTKN